MKKNLGIGDRIVRVLLGIASICLGVTFFLADYLILSILLGLFALLMIVEAIIGFCWLYKWLGINKTQKKKRR